MKTFNKVMKQNIGKLAAADLKARRRFWNKKGFFGEPTKKKSPRARFNENAEAG